MFRNNIVFSGFSVNDLQKAKAFYADTLGFDVQDGKMPGLITLSLHGDIIRCSDLYQAQPYASHIYSTQYCGRRCRPGGGRTYYKRCAL